MFWSILLPTQSKTYLNERERCLVVWALSDSLTVWCCEDIVKSVIRGGGLAKLFRCSGLARGQTPLGQFFLDSVGCQTIDDFVRYLPTTSSHTWLIFDSVDKLDADANAFFQSLIRLSYESSKFKILLFTHKTDIACSVLRWSDCHRPIQIVKPIGCCQWKESHLAQFSPDSHNIRLSVRAGCPYICYDLAASDLEAQWTFGITRLTRFLQEEWVQLGGFKVSQSRLALMSTCHPLPPSHLSICLNEIMFESVTHFCNLKKCVTECVTLSNLYLLIQTCIECFQNKFDK